MSTIATMGDYMLNFGADAFSEHKSAVFEQPETDELFARCVPIVIQNRDGKSHDLTVKIERITQPPQNQQKLVITITDETDPFFLYSLQVSEPEFHSLKAEQTLLVDFAAFPDSLIYLLDQCLNCRGEEHPKFIAVLRTQRTDSDALLCVQETNQFRHLQHIALKLRAGNDSAVKQYLAQYLMQMKGENVHTKRELHNTREELKRARMEKDQAQQYAAQVKHKTEQVMSELKVAHAEQISELRESSLEKERETRQEMRDEQTRMQEQMELQIRDLKRELEDVTKKFHALSTEKMSVDNRLSSVTESLHHTRSSFGSNKEELDRMRREYQQLDTTKFELEKRLNQQDIQIAALQQQIQDKNEICENSGNLLESTREQKVALEETLAMCKANLEKNEKKVRECVKEINKGNTIISHLQNEIRNQRSQVKSKKQTIHQLEQQLESRQQEIDELKDTNSTAKQTITELRSEVKELKNALRSCKDKLQQSHAKLEENQKVIEYLNKQWNSQINPSLFGYGGGATTKPSGIIGSSPPTMGAGMVNGGGGSSGLSSGAMFGMSGIGGNDMYGLSGSGYAPSSATMGTDRVFSTLNLSTPGHDSLASGKGRVNASLSPILSGVGMSYHGGTSGATMGSSMTGLHGVPNGGSTPGTFSALGTVSSAKTIQAFVSPLSDVSGGVGVSSPSTFVPTSALAPSPTASVNSYFTSTSPQPQ